MLNPKIHTKQSCCFGLHFILVFSIVLTSVVATFPTVVHAQATPLELPLRFGLLTESTQASLGELGPTFWAAHGYPVERYNFATTADLLAALAKGEIDLALALPVEALTDYYQLSFNALPTDQTRLTQLIQTLGEKEALIWSGAAAVELHYTFWLNQRWYENTTELPTLLSTLAAGLGADGNNPLSSTPLTFCAPQTQQAQVENILTTLQEEYALGYEDEQFVFIDPSLVQFANQSPLTDTVFLTSTVAATVTAAVTAAVTATVTTSLTVTDGVTSSVANSEPDVTLLTLTENITVQDFANCDLGFDVVPSLLFNAPNFVPLADPERVTSVNRPMLVYRDDIGERINDQLPNFEQALAAVDEATLITLLEDTLESPPTERATPTEWFHQFLLANAFIAPPTFTVGSRRETAQSVLGAMAALLLEDDGFLTTDATGSVSTTDLVGAVKTGTLDLAVLLAGDLFAVADIPTTTLPTDHDDVQTLLAEISDVLDLVVSTPAAFSLTQVLLVDADLAVLGITELSTLAAYMNRFDSPLGICMDSDFFSDPVAGLSALEAHYGFQFQPEKIFLMDDDSLFPAINNGRCQVTIGTITDGRIPAWNLVAMDDDQQFFAQNYPIFVMKNREKTGQSQVWSSLESVLSRLNAAMMQQMTRRVEIGPDGEPFSGDELTPRAAAQEYLLGQGLIQTQIPEMTVQIEDPIDSSSSAGLEP